MRVAITGGDGLIGGILRERLTDGFEARFLTRADADLEDLPGLQRGFAGADAVVHLAANADNGADWAELLGPNVIGVYHAFEAARRAGVRRLVYASSNHAVGMAMWDDERFTDAARPIEVGADGAVRPDSLYGATKAWGEAIGRLYAERHGMEVVCIRIGSVTDDDRPLPPDVPRHEPPHVARRATGMWLSHRDCASLIEAALVADVRFAIVNGVSDNAGRWFSLDECRDVLGWQPLDGVR